MTSSASAPAPRSTRVRTRGCTGTDSMSYCALRRMKSSKAGFGIAPHHAIGDASVLEQDEGRDARDLILDRELLSGVDVELRHAHLAVPLVRELVEHGRHHAGRGRTRSPRSPPAPEAPPPAPRTGSCRDRRSRSCRWPFSPVSSSLLIAVGRAAQDLAGSCGVSVSTSAREHVARGLDVASDLGGQLHHTGEGPLLPQPLVEAQLDGLAVDVGVEVEDVALDHPLVVLVDGGARADVGDRVEGGREAREDARGWRRRRRTAPGRSRGRG